MTGIINSPQEPENHHEETKFSIPEMQGSSKCKEQKPAADSPATKVMKLSRTAMKSKSCEVFPTSPVAPPVHAVRGGARVRGWKMGGRDHSIIRASKH